MNRDSADRLYGLLPALYRIRDAEVGQPLRALLGIIEEQVQALENDVEGLYRNWFIETCENWVVPYIGDLLGARGLRDIEGTAFTLRAFVANALAYRRRKGTLGVLEDLARDVTGWRAHAVEFFQRLDTNQHINHVRLGHPRTYDIRDIEPMALVDGPFGVEVHTAEVRPMARHNGRYNIPNIGIYLWRLGSFEVDGASARAVPGSGDPNLLWYRFDPSNRDVPLFNQPVTETDISHITEEVNVPGELRNSAIGRALPPKGELPNPATPYLGSDAGAVFEIRKDDTPVPVEDLMAFLPKQRLDPGDEAALNDWDQIVPPPGRVAVDPERGRLVVHLGSGESAPSEVTVKYSYGFSANLGAGPYDRSGHVMPDSTSPDWQMGVGRSVTPVPGEVVPSLAEAVDDWNAFAIQRWTDDEAGSFGILTVMDNRTYVEDLTADHAIWIPPYSVLLVVAAGWSPEKTPDGGPDQRVLGHYTPNELRPHILGSIEVYGESDDGEPESRGALSIDGLQIEGSLTVLAGDLGRLDLAHTTLIPEAGGLIVEPPDDEPIDTGNIGLQIGLKRSICGVVSAPETVESLALIESIVDGGAATGTTIEAPGTATEVKCSTVLGPVDVQSLVAENSILDGLVTVRRRQSGCVRFGYVSPDSQTPRRYRCQPELAMRSAANDELKALIRGRLVPSYTSRLFGQPGYVQLSRVCPEEILSGAEDGSEMGVFGFLKQPQREANLRSALQQFLRVGLRAGFFYVT